MIVKICLREGGARHAGESKEQEKKQPESQDTCAPCARAAGTCQSHFLENSTQESVAAFISTDTSLFLAPQVSKFKLSWLWPPLCFVFLLSTCLITIPQGEKTDCDTSQWAPWEKPRRWKIRESIFYFPPSN